MKLGKNEKKILVSLLEHYGLHYDKRLRRNTSYYPKGKNSSLLAKSVYPDKEITDIEGNLINTVKASLSTTLNNMWKKGLVKKAKPDYVYKWHPKDTEFGSTSGGCMHCELISFNAKEYQENGEIKRSTINVPRLKSLPTYTRIWWILTDKGYKIAEELV